MYKPEILDDKPKVLDLFCGAGGLSLGFENAGFQILCTVENHSDPIKTYLYNRLENPPTPKILIEDVRNIRRSNIDKAIAETFKKRSNIDVVIGGSPCQGFSLRGKREKNDPSTIRRKSHDRFRQKAHFKFLIFSNI